MAPRNPLEREADDLAKEYHNASIATRSMMQAQARLTQILSKHANVAVASIASMVQDIANAKTNTALKQQELASLRAQQAVNQRKHQADLRALQEAANNLNANKTRLRQLSALGTSRTSVEEAELNARLAYNRGLQNRANTTADKERKSRSAMDTLNNQMGIKTSELRNIKFTAVATAANSLADGMQKLVSTINKTQEQFGLAAGQAANLKVDNIVSSFNSYVESAKSLFSGKPEFGVSAEMIERAQAAYQNEFGGILTTDAAKDLAMQARTMGVTAEQLTNARRVFTTQTLGNVAEAKNSQDKFIAEFEKKGLTSKEAMQAISQYSELLARNGTRFAQSFTRAAADAKKIGIDLTKVSQFGDSLINNFEGFLEGQATLGAMGFNLDSNRLAQISETGSDADLFNELRSQLASTGKDITKLRRSERLELESAFGMNISEMQRLAGATPGGDTKSAEELQSEANGFLARMAVGMELLAKTLGVAASIALSAIAASSAVTAVATSITAGMTTLMASPLLAIAGLIAGVAAVFGVGVGVGAFFGKGSEKKSTTKGDDVVSQSGYGKRSLVTPSGVIALNNKDNIIAYADDLVGTKKLPYGVIAKKVVDGLVTDKSDFLQNAIIKKLGSEGLARIPAIASKLAKPVPVLGTALGGVLDGYGEYKKSNSVLRGLGKGAMSMGGGLLGNLLGGVGGTFAGGPIGTAVGAATGGVGGSTIANKLFDKFVPKGIAGNLLGKIGLGSLGGNLLGGLAGGPMGMLGMAAPLLKKIPFVGSALGAIAGGPNKLIGSALGKIGGLFGKKKAPAISAMGAMMPEMGNLMSMLPFLSGAQPATAQGISQPQAPILVDTSGIEKQLNNFINALSNIQVNMDGTKVGKLLVSSNEAAASLGVFRAQSR